ncbi:luciferin 4-monooxygenase-like isoform X4 [Cataglyphis hispanica]|uniref:luciferin 4-monooxygenase-like isoform X4 n=1 Tax=Cataglyphis hispanica TaxID=1086592 RepID=UPI00217F640B|nr:luciferin 4-monooxygenase-like isoform X4 [Cataglyphis hispanica]
MATKSTVSFKIENNILFGKEAPIDECINIGELILSAFKSRPDFVGQVDAITGEENTFDQMRERSVKCALWLKKFGVQRNDIVVVCTSNYLDAYIPFLASLYIDATLIVWRENRPINYRHYMRSGPKVIFTDVDKVSSILNVANMLNISTKIIVLFEEEEEEKEETEKVESINSILMNDFDEAEVDEFSCIKLESNKDIAVILFSVGTIGDIRKHVTIPYAFFTSPSNQHVPIMSSNDVGMWNESLHWNISLLLTVRCILSYVKAIKINEFLYPSLEMSFCNIIEKFKVTWVFLKISMGLPEVGMITYQEKTGKSESSGYVCNNVNLAITHYISGILLEANKLGIIQCKSPCLTNGCFSSLPVDLIPLPDDNNGWFCTDDVGYYDSDGELYVLDRTKNIIQYRYNYFLPASIEQLLRKHPKVRDCAVIPLYNTLDVHHPLAIVVPNKGAKIVQEELIQFVSENAVDCLKLRGGVLFRHALKYLRNGQLDRRTLHKWAKDDLHDKAYFSRKASQKKT